MLGQVFEPDYVTVEFAWNPDELVEEWLYIKQLLLLDVCSFKYLIGWAEVGRVATFVIRGTILIWTVRLCFRNSKKLFVLIGLVFLLIVLIFEITRVLHVFSWWSFLTNVWFGLIY